MRFSSHMAGVTAPASAHAPAPSSGSFTSVNAHPQPPSAIPRRPSPSPPTRPSRLSEATAKAAADSQPMSKSASASSATVEQNATATEPNGVSPYGTRSRNRAGISRPNYAEDRDLDADYHAETDKSPGTNTRRSSNAAPVPVAHEARSFTASPASHQIPGMSSFSVHGETTPAPPPPSRKRKAPGSNQPVIAATTTATVQTTGAGRKAATAASNAVRRENNLMTFENSHAILRNGKLKADDGTTLAVNGEFRAQF